ncbi:MAG TPA: hypothetical protein VN132_09460 [Bdellovibrio sp.]|nr:hypothetical protein [Bdellovibrio sp.]
MKKIVLIFSFTLLSHLNVSATASASTKTINDSLVENLSCQKLGINQIYEAFRDEAFDSKRHMPIQNWSFRSNGVRLAGCWALSSTQRMFTYLARYNESSAKENESRTENVLNMVRRSIPENAPMGEANQDMEIRDVPLKDYTVFQLRENSLSDDSLYGHRGLWTDIAKGFTQYLDFGQRVPRNFKADVEINQADHFFQPGNIGMGVGSGPRNPEENRKTLRVLMRNLSGKRLTLIDLRLNQMTQHVVMVKSYQADAQGNVIFKVYDSNQIERDHEVRYQGSNQQFYAPDVMGVFGGYGALGVYIVSEKEREGLEQALLKYYRAQWVLSKFSGFLVDKHELPSWQMRAARPHTPGQS